MSIQSIRDNSQSLLAKIIVGLIAITFALFGVDAIVGNSGNNSSAADVNGEEVSTYELNRTIELTRRQELNNMGDNPDPTLLDENLIKVGALNQLIDRKLRIQDAESQDIYVPGSMVDQSILSTPAFQIDGRFDQYTFESAVRSIGMMPREYKNELSVDFQLQQPESAIAQSAFMMASEAKKLAELERQMRNIAYLRLKVEDLSKDIVISDQLSNDHYEANQQNYMTTEQVQLEYLELKRDDFAGDVEVDEAELKQLFDQAVQRSKNMEERRASHILVEINEETDKGSAQAKIEEVLAKLSAGEDFAELAKAYSEDLGSAEEGGDLGFVERGAFSEAFDEILFNLEAGQTSDIVETDFGFHIIRLDEIRAVEPPKYEELVSELEQEIRLQKAEQLFVEAADNLQNDSYSAGDLLEPAERLDLKVKTTALFTREGGEGIAENQKVIRTAFSDEVLVEGNNSDLIEITSDHVVVVRTKQHLPAKVRPYEEVADMVKDELKQRSASEQVQKQGEQVLADLRSGKTTEQISEEYGFEWKVVDRVERAHKDLDRQINSRVFKMPKPGVGEKTLDGMTAGNGDFVVIALTKVYEGGVTEIHEKEIEILQGFLSDQLARQDLQDYMQNLRNSADIVKY